MPRLLIRPERYSLRGFRCKFFENAEKEDDESLCHIYAGYFGKGELLSVNICGESREKCIETLKILETLQKI